MLKINGFQRYDAFRGETNIEFMLTKKPDKDSNNRKNHDEGH